MLQDRSLSRLIPFPPPPCLRIFRATASSFEINIEEGGETGIGVPTNVTSIVGFVYEKKKGLHENLGTEVGKIGSIVES